MTGVSGADLRSSTISFSISWMSGAASLDILRSPPPRAMNVRILPAREKPFFLAVGLFSLQDSTDRSLCSLTRLSALVRRHGEPSSDASPSREPLRRCSRALAKARRESRKIWSFCFSFGSAPSHSGRRNALKPGTGCGGPSRCTAASSNPHVSAGSSHASVLLSAIHWASAVCTLGLK